MRLLRSFVKLVAFVYFSGIVTGVVITVALMR